MSSEGHRLSPASSRSSYKLFNSVSQRLPFSASVALGREFSTYPFSAPLSLLLLLYHFLRLTLFLILKAIHTHFRWFYKHKKEK